MRASVKTSQMAANWIRGRIHVYVYHNTVVCMAEKTCSREKEGYVIQKFQERCHKRSEENNKADPKQGDLELKEGGKMGGQ